ncbi:energy transducer TonB [Flammeovirga kamogawensis]|uniref:Energy transducer TonB n=1 Tax=Flammeovirga kamogawensis TaxID=373891 RepID=A0ABX8GUW6_9BACT|nr:energy transducer TonB [Flammeovirga kamogawensis]MBB6459621.1 TonB family protein [Flammeovirga kamogawensis]QWG07316.1 energy transducer TonB [Flammeovirga kamogawensis]TRX69133.1 energy transducer TonB [Flammeovirga kamogawensis]
MKKLFTLLVSIIITANVFADDDKPLYKYTQAKAINYDEITQTIDYPKVGKDLGIEGSVKVRAYINVDGEVVDYEIMRGSETRLASAVEDAIMNLTFEPTIVTNTITGEQQAVPSWVIVPFNFSLEY